MWRAWAANATIDGAGADLAGALAISAAIAAGNTLAALAAGYLIERWSDGRRTFDTPVGVAKFAVAGLGPGAMISATAGVGGWWLAGYADAANFVPLWVAWWLRDAAGVLVVAPVVVLWASGGGPRRAVSSWRPPWRLPARSSLASSPSVR